MPYPQDTGDIASRKIQQPNFGNGYSPFEGVSWSGWWTGLGFGKVMADSVGRLISRLFRRPRNLKRVLKRQSTEAYWRRRRKSSMRRLRFVSGQYSFRTRVADLRQGLPIVPSTAMSCLLAVLSGGLLSVLFWSIERLLTGYPLFGFLLLGDGSALEAFPTLAVPVLAAFLGFYLATVGIVMGHSYEGVPESVRQLVLRDPGTRWRLRWLCRALGYGLVLILFHGLGQAFGLLTAGVYSLLVGLGIWCFFRLAFGAFEMFDPVVPGFGLLPELSRTISRLGAGGLFGDDAVLWHTARKTDRSLRVVSEIVGLISDRQSSDRTRLADMTTDLLRRVQDYSGKKGLLKPDSGWFLPKPVYPRWVEANQDEASLAVNASTPLLTRTEPQYDWLERRVAELASSALRVCVEANDTDSALRITHEMANTAWILARHSWIDDAIVFAGIFHDQCLDLNTDSDSEGGNEALYAVADNPRFLLTTLLLGWKEALTSWPSEIQGIVDSNEWDGRAKGKVRILGPARLRKATQRLLKKVQAELDIGGDRVTPKWFLRSELATECIVSLGKFSDELPELLDEYSVKENDSQHPSHVRASIGLQALQAIAKADLLAEAIPKTIEALEGLQQGHARIKTPEVARLPERLRACRAEVLKRIAETASDLQPEKTTTRPDYFGQVLATLLHHTEQAIADGNTALVADLFPATLSATLIQQKHLILTYKPPHYQFSSWVLHPMIDILEISGLSLVYEALRGDNSAQPVRMEWRSWIQQGECPSSRASGALDILDDEATDFALASRKEFAWHRRLREKVIEAGYARPPYSPFSETPEWNAPSRLKMLGVSEEWPMLGSVKPRTIFAGEVIAPLTGEPETQLRERPGLKHYYAESERHDP